MADWDRLCRATDGELLAIRAPADRQGSPVDSQDDKLGLPVVGLLIVRPHEGVAIMRAADDLVVDGRPVDA